MSNITNAASHKELLACLQERIHDHAAAAEERVLRGVNAQRVAFAKAALQIAGSECDAALGRGLYSIQQTHEGLVNLHEANGELSIWVGFRLIVKDEIATREPSTALFEKLRDDAARLAIGDSRRSQFSTDPFSNAVAAASGAGRGRAYRDLFERLETIVRRAEQLDAAADKAEFVGRLSADLNN
jgi:hypothetical protein